MCSGNLGDEGCSFIVGYLIIGSPDFKFGDPVLVRLG